jgi:hypothetical protein
MPTALRNPAQNADQEAPLAGLGGTMDNTRPHQHALLRERQLRSRFFQPR